jgi:rhomboid family GlyGly-CTERM serine protease
MPGGRGRVRREGRNGAARSSVGVAVWIGLCAALAGLAGLGTQFPAELLDWQPALLPSQPWRAWSAVAVHYSDAHLLGNLAGAAAIAALGWAARVPLHLALAWAAAWPFTHLGLLFDRQLAHYGGLSGVLHAAVAVCAVHLLRSSGARQRRIGAAIGIGLALKVGFEFPWRPTFHAELAITVAPLAHLSGVLAGLVCALGAMLLGQRRAASSHV